tara:strand:- start:5 stop:715 length:711 start_codon:yes stop_codon:yes gene_type:complete
MLGLGNSVSAGQYPGGWSPTSLGSKLAHWYKFNTGITKVTASSVDGQVSQWADQHGSNNLTPTADDNKDVMPKLHDDGTVFFNATGDSLEFGSDLSFGKFSIYMKVNWKEDSTIATTEDLFEHASSGDFIKLAGPTAARIKISSRHDFTINEMVEGTPFVLGYERNGDGDMMVYKDNVAGSAADGDSLNVAISTTIDLDRLGKPTNDSYWYEIVICDDIITSDERNELFTYLSNVG